MVQMVHMLVILHLLMFANASHERIAMTSVKELILHREELTTGRRVAPIQQLICRGIYCDSAPYTIVCNIDKDVKNTDWKCHAELYDDIKFDTIHVQCEGFDYPDDTDILVGSCGIEYRLISTNPGVFKSYKGFIFIVILLIIWVLFFTLYDAESNNIWFWMFIWSIFNGYSSPSGHGGISHR